ncbi:MAG: hypothetical protein NE327_20815 [Lentisphaeraceae bacterium]|nr:hypothetical protein [Lentisphaeraceae bacterium]
MSNEQLPSNIVQGVAIGNLKSISEQPSMLSNLAYSNSVANTNLSQQNAVSNQQALNEVAISVTGKAVNNIANLGPLEARSAVDILTNDEIAQTIADLKATLESFGGGSSGHHSLRINDEVALVFLDPDIKSLDDLTLTWSEEGFPLTVVIEQNP